MSHGSGAALSDGPPGVPPRRAGRREEGPARPADTLPDALDPEAGVPAVLGDGGDRRPLAVFLDFDGTLSPIVDRPESARLSRGMREAVRRLARRSTVAVLSGRDLRDVRHRIGLPGVWYAGSHGLEVAAPRGRGLALARGREFLAELDGAEAALREAIRTVPGASVERKRFAIAVHLRRVAEGDRIRVETAFSRIVELHPRLRATSGKEVRELLPALEWDKGAAVEWLLERAPDPDAGAVPVAIGDDVTDEDAFRVVRRRGAAVVVGAGDRLTLATHALGDVAEVPELLGRLSRLAERRSRGRAEGRPS